MRMKLLTAIICLSSVYVQGAILQLPVLQDTYVSLTAPTTNYSTAASFTVARQATSGTVDRYPFIQFDISRIYGIDPSKIISAKLKLYMPGTSNTSFSGVISKVEAPWIASSLVWNNMPSATDVSGSTWAGANGGTTYNTLADVTTLVRNWASGTWPNYGLRMRTYGGTTYQMSQFDSKEETTRGLNPVIEVEFDGSLTGERVVPVNIVHDSYVDAANATTNFGNSSQLYIARDTASNRETYLQFELTGLTGINPDSIESATLKLHRALTTGQTGGLLGRVTSTWDESTITWNSAPTVTETDGYTWDADSGEGYNASIDVTDLVKNWQNGTWGNYGVRMRLASGAYCLMIFDSSEETTRKLRPVIEVTLKTYGSFDVPWFVGSIGSKAIHTDQNGNVWKFCESAGRGNEYLNWSSYSVMTGILDGSDRYWKGNYAIINDNASGWLGRVSGYFEPFVAGKYSKHYNGAIVLEPAVSGLYSWYGQLYWRTWAGSGPFYIKFVKFAENDFPTLVHSLLVEEGNVYEPVYIDLSGITELQNISVRSNEKLAMIVRPEVFGSHMVAEFQAPLGLTIAPGGCDEKTKLAGDVNGDCKLDITDLSSLAGNWLKCSDGSKANCF